MKMAPQLGCTLTVKVQLSKLAGSQPVNLLANVGLKFSGESFYFGSSESLDELLSLPLSV